MKHNSLLGRGINDYFYAREREYKNDHFCPHHANTFEYKVQDNGESKHVACSWHKLKEDEDGRAEPARFSDKNEFRIE